jgi:hypothetical protein
MNYGLAADAGITAGMMVEMLNVKVSHDFGSAITTREQTKRTRFRCIHRHRLGRSETCLGAADHAFRGSCAIPQDQSIRGVCFLQSQRRQFQTVDFCAFQVPHETNPFRDSHV